MELVYDCTFAGVGFVGEQARDLLRPIFATKAKRAIRLIPYGDRAIYQYLGRDVAEVGLPILIEAGDYAGLRALVGQSGTLALVGGPSEAGVVLDALDQTGQDDANGIVEATATFLRVG